MKLLLLIRQNNPRLHLCTDHNPQPKPPSVPSHYPTTVTTYPESHAFLVPCHMPSASSLAKALKSHNTAQPSTTPLMLGRLEHMPRRAQNHSARLNLDSFGCTAYGFVQGQARRGQVYVRFLRPSVDSLPFSLWAHVAWSFWCSGASVLSLW
jgi:hypothetical protein